MNNLSAEEYRPILFFLSWFLILEILAIIMIMTTQGYNDMIPILLLLLLVTAGLLILFILKARKAIIEELA